MLSKKTIIILAVLFVVVVSIIYSSSSDGTKDFVSPTVYGDYSEKIKASGRLSEKGDVVLSFENAGTIQSFSHKEGAKGIKKGTVLSSLSSTDLDFQLTSARARLARERATLQKLLEGATESEVRVYSSNLLTAKSFADSTTLSATATLEKVIQDTYTNVLVVVYQHFSNAATSPVLDIRVLGDDRSYLEAGAKKIYTDFHLTPVLEDISHLGVIKSIGGALDQLEYLQTYIRRFIDILNSPNHNETRVELEQLSTFIAVQKTLLIDAMSSITSALFSADRAIEEYKRVTASEEDSVLDQQYATIAIYQSEVGQIMEKLKHSFIRAPFNGRVAEILKDMVETVSAGTPVIRFTSDGVFEIEATVSELNIVYIKEAQMVNFKVDALADIFTGTVDKISYTEELVGNTPTYKVVIGNINSDSRLRPGLSATVDFEKQRYTNTLVVKSDAITHREGNAYVTVQTPDGEQEKQIEIGIYFPEGNVQVLSGLQKSSKVLINKR